MRWNLLALLFGLSVALAGCDTFKHSEVKTTFLNSTDTLLCDSYYAQPLGVPKEGPCEGRSGEAIEPQKRTTRRPGCGYGGDDEDFELTVVIVVASDGRVIYERTANCKDWKDADATFIIKQRGREFSVTDSLPGGPDE